MHTHVQSMAFSARVLVHVAAAMRAAAQRLRATGRRLDAWLARRPLSSAMRELQAMSYRELRDIGLTRFDVQHLAWGGEAPGRPWQHAAEAECDACECRMDIGDAPALRDVPTLRNVRELDNPPELASIEHLNVHTLKDIGAPHWLVARAAERRDTEHLRWLGLEHG